jgi:hypothetical protein
MPCLSYVETHELLCTVHQDSVCSDFGTSRARKSQKTSWTTWPLKIGPIHVPEASVNIYHTTPRNIPEERRSQEKRKLILWDGGIVKNLQSLSLSLYRAVQFYLQFKNYKKLNNNESSDHPSSFFFLNFKSCVKFVSFAELLVNFRLKKG